MLTNCFRFAPRDSVPGIIAKICKYLKDHPGWSEEELEEQIKQFIGQTGVESFNGRTGAVVLNEDDVNNLKIASAYFAEGDETIDDLDLVPLYNQGVRFVFTNWNSATSGYDLAFVLDYFSGSNDVVYYPMATGSGGGNIISVNGKTGIVELSLSDILGDSGAQVKLCTATEFTSNTLAAWNAYYEDGYRIVGVVNSDSTAIDYLYLLKQDENSHQPIGLSTGASEAYTPTNPPPYPVESVNGKTGVVAVGEAGVVEKESDANQYTQIFVDESEDYPPIDAGLLNGKAGKYYLSPRNLLDNSDFRNPVNQRGQTSYTGVGYSIDRWYGTPGNTTVNSGYVSITKGTNNYALWVQYCPNISTGKTYTLATKTKAGQIVVLPFTAKTDMGEVKTTINTNTEELTARYSTGKSLYYVGISNIGDTTIDIEWIALYEGEYTTDSLPPYVPKGYAAELAECMRYYQHFSAFSSSPAFGAGYAHSATIARMGINLAVPMRTTPTVNITALSDWRLICAGAACAPTGVSVGTSIDGNKNVKLLSLQIETTGLTANNVFALKPMSTWTLSADL